MFTQKVYAEVCLGNPRHPIVKSHETVVLFRIIPAQSFIFLFDCNPIYFSFFIVWEIEHCSVVNFLSYSFEYLSTIGALSVT